MIYYVETASVMPLLSGDIPVASGVARLGKRQYSWSAFAINDVFLAVSVTVATRNSVVNDGEKKVVTTEETSWFITDAPAGTVDAAFGAVNALSYYGISYASKSPERRGIQWSYDPDIHTFDVTIARDAFTYEFAHPFPTGPMSVSTTTYCATTMRLDDRGQEILARILVLGIGSSSPSSTHHPRFIARVGTEEIRAHGVPLIQLSTRERLEPTGAIVSVPFTIADVAFEIHYAPSGAHATLIEAVGRREASAVSPSAANTISSLAHTMSFFWFLSRHIALRTPAAFLDAITRLSAMPVHTVGAAETKTLLGVHGDRPAIRAARISAIRIDAKTYLAVSRLKTAGFFIEGSAEDAAFAISLLSLLDSPDSALSVAEGRQSA